MHYGLTLASLQVFNAIAVRITPPEDEQKNWSYTPRTRWSSQPEVISYTIRINARFHKSSKTHACYQKAYPQNSFHHKLSRLLKINFFLDFVTTKLTPSTKQWRKSNEARRFSLEFFK